MNKLKQYFSLAIVFWGAANLSQSSLAQYWVPIQPPVPSHDIMFPGVRERSVDQNKGSDPAPRFRSPNPSDAYSPTKRFISYEQQKFCESLLEKKVSSVWAQVYQQNGCKDGSAPKYFSMRWDRPVSVKFINQRNHRINIYWLDYQGIAQFYRSLAPGEWYVQQTFMTHPWWVSDENNRGLAVLLPERNVDEAVIR
jgi:hypothetical protein